jgi:flagellar basal body-associated protein FliL
MARPTKPKDLKPKVEGEASAAPAAGGGGLDLKFIILIVVAILAPILGSAGSTYLITTMVVMPELTKAAAAAKPGDGDGQSPTGPDGASTETPANQVGMNLELDEFTVNLKADPSMEGTQYLRAKMALSIKVPEKENCYATEKAALAPMPIRVQGGKIVGAAAPVARTSVDRTMLAEEGGGPSCEQVFKNNMGKYVPTIRDVINAALMKRTATALATLEGQEALKDEIKDQLNQILAPNYEVLRVNFQDFIIQK